jgi:hypothetical protein
MDAANYQELVEQYRRRADEEILRLASSFEDLTEDAETTLIVEMRRRELGETHLADNRSA